jgi:hypothetical protein
MNRLTSLQVMKDKLIHVFTREFADLALRELDTVSDFCEYLRKKEAIDNRVRILLMGGEQNLLANYLHAGRSFDWTKDGDLIIIEDTNWDGFSQRPEYLAKKQEDEVSYGWDSIIDRAHDTPSERYERIARELARADRFMRRILAKDFLEAYVKYVKTRPPTFRRFLSVGDTTYCFLFMEDGQDRREHRQTLLQIMCFVARGIGPMNQRVIGIATEFENRSYDYCVLYKPQWSKKDEERKIRYQKEFGIFRDPQLTTTGVDEYPIPI